MNSNDLEYELIRLVWSGRFQWCIICLNREILTHVEEIRWKLSRSDHESDLKVTICLICLQFAIFYLLNKARIEIRLIWSKKVDFRVDLGWARVWSQSTRMVETSPTMYNLCFYDVGNILVHVWYSPAEKLLFIIKENSGILSWYKRIQ